MAKKSFLLISIASLVCVAISGLIIFSNHNLSFLSNAIDKTYQITFNSTKNKFFSGAGTISQSGDAVVKTDLDNNVGFSFSDIAGGSSSVWHLVKGDGYFYNTTPIKGMSKISAQFTAAEKSYKVYWSGDTTFTEEKSMTLSSDTSMVDCNFNNYYPTYFKFVNTSGSNLSITNMLITLTCLNNYPYISLQNENPTMGSVSGGGMKHASDNVTIVATPNSGYRFVGWYSGETLISSLSSYSFIMGNDDLNYVARFTYESYNLVVQTESIDKGTVSNSSGSYDYLSEITISAQANNGYTFDGWYEGETLVSHDNPYTFDMPYSNKTYTAKFTTNSYDVELTNNNPILGSISGDGIYLYGSNVTLTATPNIGVSFLGWYDGDDLISVSNPYVFSMPHEDLNYIAKFDWTPYSVTLTINDSTMGSVSGSGSYIYDQQVTLTATPNEHHSFFGWYDGENLVSSDTTYTFNMPTNSLNYEARFVRNYNLNVYSDNESMGTVTAPTEWGAGLEVTVQANAKDGYAIDYWADENYDEVDYNPNYSFVMPSHDVELIAVFDVGYLFSATTNEPSKCIVSGGNRYKAGRQVSASMTNLSGIFRGWYENGNSFITKNSSISFVMPNMDYSVEAKFWTDDEETRLAVKPILSDDHKTITYGLYPQTNINDSTIINSLNSLSSHESNGWYLFNNEYYANVVATPLVDGSYTFDNGETISSGETYWFKCEPIVWSVLSNNSSEYYAVSSVLLDSHNYYYGYLRTIDGQTVYRNNYKYSDLRSWLNEDFYNCAFALCNDYVQTTNVDNSAPTTNSSTNKYACANTQDKVFLPSYQDYKQSDYGFSNSTGPDQTRYCRTTDWARARGAYVSNDYQKNGMYWTRSPATSSDTGETYHVWFITQDGMLSYRVYSVSDNEICVRPSLLINII